MLLYILYLKVHEKAKNKNCYKIYFERMTLDHTFSDRNEISQILLAS